MIMYRKVSVTLESRPMSTITANSMHSRVGVLGESCSIATLYYIHNHTYHVGDQVIRSVPSQGFSLILHNYKILLLSACSNTNFLKCMNQGLI